MPKHAEHPVKQKERGVAQSHRHNTVTYERFRKYSPGIWSENTVTTSENSPATRNVERVSKTGSSKQGKTQRDRRANPEH